MNILVTLDSNYILPLTVMLRSLMDSNRQSDFDIYVAHSSLTELDFAKISNNVDLSRTRIHNIKVDDALFENAPVLKRITKETYFRLLVTDYLPKEVDRILYIDPDTLIINPLNELYNIEFGDNLIAAAGHTKGLIEIANRVRLNMSLDAQYVNAGIIMMNIQAMRREVKTADIFHFIEKNIKKLYLADQDVINALFWRKTIRIDACVYNLDEKTLKNNRHKINLDWVRRNTVIIHYNGCFKPWKENYHGQMADFWHHYNTGSLNYKSTSVLSPALPA